MWLLVMEASSCMRLIECMHDMVLANRNEVVAEMSYDIDLLLLAGPMLG